MKTFTPKPGQTPRWVREQEAIDGKLPPRRWTSRRVVLLSCGIPALAVLLLLAGTHPFTVSFTKEMLGMSDPLVQQLPESDLLGKLKVQCRQDGYGSIALRVHNNSGWTVHSLVVEIVELDRHGNEVPSESRFLEASFYPHLRPLKSGFTSCITDITVDNRNHQFRTIAAYGTRDR